MNNPNPHIEAYTLAKYGRNIFPLLTDEAIRLSLASYFGFHPSEKDVQTFLDKIPPKSMKTTIIKHLKSMGFSQMQIAELTGMSQAMVSRYANRETKDEYVPSYYFTFVRSEYTFEDDHRFREYYFKFIHVKQKII